MYLVNHIFLPPKLPQEDDLNDPDEHAIIEHVYQSSQEYFSLIRERYKSRWSPIVKMLKNLCSSHETFVLSGEDMERSMTEMEPGGKVHSQFIYAIAHRGYVLDVLGFLIRAQNAGFILRKSKECTVFESFEVSPSAEAVMGCKGRLLCSYPGPAISVPSEIANNPKFCKELASFLAQMNVDVLDSSPTTIRAGVEVEEESDTPHPRYITELLVNILRGMGEPAKVTRIRKRIADDVLCDRGSKPWRRSPMWLFVRVVIQTSLYHESDGHIEYKRFMVFFMERFLRRAVSVELSSDTLFWMRAKVARRLHKLGVHGPSFIITDVLDTSNRVANLLETRWSKVQKDQATSPPWAPETLDIVADSCLSLVNSKAYITRVLTNSFPNNASNFFSASHIPRVRDGSAFRAFAASSLSDTLQSTDRYITLADFEFAVETCLDDWIAENNTNSDACTTLTDCFNQYADAALVSYKSNPEDSSRMLLTLFELWVGLDKVVVKQCPLLRRYSPEIPLNFLASLLLKTSPSFERLAAIEKYLRERHRIADSGSIFTDKVDSSIFAVRYFDTSQEHQSLHSRILANAASDKQKKIEELQSLNAEYQKTMDQVRSMDCTFYISLYGHSCHDRQCNKCRTRRYAEDLQIRVHEWPLPENIETAKLVLFELMVPRAVECWRSTTYKLLRDICTPSPAEVPEPIEPPLLLINYSGLEPYMSGVSRITLASTTKSFLHTHYETVRIPETSESRVCVKNGLHFRYLVSFNLDLSGF